MVFLALLVVPVLIAVFGFIFLKGITWKEFLAQLGVQMLIAGISAAVVSCQATSDTEVWNGVVTSKHSDRVSCSHSYSCNCHEKCTGSGKNRSCSQVCQTCYEHLYDIDWNVDTSNGERVEIDRVDRQGVLEPSRYTRVQIGEPTTIPHDFVNYIKAAPGTLFRHQGIKEKYGASLPSYPEVYDLYRINRVLTVGFSLPDASTWNDALSRLNAEVGRSKQANVILVLVRGHGQDWFYGLEEAWIGGKKNDVVLVVGVDDQLKAEWATVMCWTTQEIFKVQLRNDILDAGPLTVLNTMDVLKRDVNQYYARKPMADFKYLEANITPSTVQWVVTVIIGLLVAFGLTWLFQVQDVFGDDNPFKNFGGFGRRRRYNWQQF